MNQEKWQLELYQSGSWLLYSFFGIWLVCFVMIGVLRYTSFGRQFAVVVAPSLKHANWVKVGSFLSVLLLLVLFEVRISVLNTFFYNGLYSALQNKVFEAFWFFAGINALLMGVKIIHAIVDEWLSQVFMIRWLERLNQALTGIWLAQRNYYYLQVRCHTPDNIDQRIQQDAQDFISSTVEVVRGTINSVVSVVEFSVILWGLSGLISLFGMDIPRGMVGFIYVFILVATLISVWIGFPLVQLNFQNEQFNGNYRYALIRVRDHAESIAFYQGESHELMNLRQYFHQVIQNRWRIVYRSLGLNGFNTSITQLSNLLPLMLQAPRFFAGQVTLGDMHQTVQAFNRLQRALSFFRNFYERFAAYQARLERLHGFFVSMNEWKMHPQAQRIVQTNELCVHDLSLFGRDGQVLLQSISMRLQAGDALLIQGESGIGKTSLLRALAGFWPFGCRGDIRMPEQEQTMFVPQRPYVPQGSLRQAICYPHTPEQYVHLEQLLVDCRLDNLIPYLAHEDDWQHRLSPGELQRIAFVRILIIRPQLVLLDEATSALDEETEEILYRLIRSRLPDSMIVSIGHRRSLREFHNQWLSIQSVGRSSHSE